MKSSSFHHHPYFSFLLILSFSLCLVTESTLTTVVQRRFLHQPLFPATSAPPPATELPQPPPQSPPESGNFPNPDEPFFPEVPATTSPSQNQNQNLPPPPSPVTTNGSIPIPAATQPSKPAKKVAIAISVGIVTLGMLSALAFFLYRHRKAKQTSESQSQKLVGPTTHRFDDETRPQPPSSFLYIGTVEPSRRSVGGEVNAIGSPYHKLNSVKTSDRYRPSPELQPLPQLTKPPPPPPPQNESSPPAATSSSSSDDDDGESSHETAFYTPHGSSASTAINDDYYYTPAAVSRSVNGNSKYSNANGLVPHSKRTSPRSRLSASSPEMKHVSMIPSIRQQPQPPPPPPAREVSQRSLHQRSPQAIPYSPKRPKFSTPPPPPNMELLRSLDSSSSRSHTTKIPIPPPPPPPPPPALSTPRKVGSYRGTASSTPTPLFLKQQSWTPSTKSSSGSGISRSSVKDSNRSGSASDKIEEDSIDSTKPKLKPLHWDKVKATSDRATVWDQLKSSSFQLNEDMMETLFGCHSVNSAPKEPIRKSVLPPVERENRVLDPKKSQNIAILLRALNVTRDEVSEALIDGNPDSLGAELLETLVKMAPTKEEEIKLREYSGDITKLGSAERFLKTVLDIPFAFKRVEAMLYRANFDTEVNYLRKSYQTLEEASEELKNSKLFLKLLEAVLKTGNRMNVGTNRGDAKAFKLDTLLKLADVKGTDGKTTLLHFVVQEIVRSEDAGSNAIKEKTQSSIRDDEFRKQGLQVVAGLSRDLNNVKKAAGMDSDVLSSYVLKLEKGLEKVKLVLQYENLEMQQGKFFSSMKTFLKEAEEEIARVKSVERKALSLVKEVTEYFHGDTAKEEAHPLRIFMIVRDFLSILDHVCKEVGMMQDRTMVGSARSFRISSTASLPVLSRYNVRRDTSSDEESSSP